jgi:hypothetical protein
MRQRVWPMVVLVLLSAIGFAYFPGHTYLQSDTQIYVPILERLDDPSLFEQEILAQRPHVSFTIYDESASVLRKLTGLRFETVLHAQQVLFRLCGLVGVYLIALALGLGVAPSLLVAACLGLGATIMGPSVLIFEYEPVPRAFAIGLTLLAIGLLANRKHLWAGCIAALAFLYHLPAVYPYWIAYFVLILVRRKPGELRQHLLGLAPMVAGVALLLILSQLQTGHSERQEFFSRITDTQEKMMRERASYLWVSLWSPRFYWQYIVYWGLSLVAIWRLRSRITADLGVMSIVTPAVGMLSMPVSYLLLEKAKWSLMPQIQPMRALLYITAFAMILAACAAVRAGIEKKWWECGAWFAVAVAPSALTRTWHSLFEAPYRRNATAVLLAALLLAGAMWVYSRSRTGWVAVTVAALLLPLVVRGVSGVLNYPPLHHAELDELASWARAGTPKDSVFLFPAAAKDLHPGVFRAESLRALYVDWKGGGQINFLRDFVAVWLPRWEAAVAPGFAPDKLGQYAAMGVDYVAVFRKNAVPAVQPVFENSRYIVYKVR